MGGSRYKLWRIFPSITCARAAPPEYPFWVAVGRWSSCFFCWGEPRTGKRSSLFVGLFVFIGCSVAVCQPFWQRQQQPNDTRCVTIVGLGWGGGGWELRNFAVKHCSKQVTAFDLCRGRWAAVIVLTGCFLPGLGSFNRYRAYCYTATVCAAGNSLICM